MTAKIKNGYVAPATATCASCRVRKPIDQFSTHGGRVNRRCKACESPPKWPLKEGEKLAPPWSPDSDSWSESDDALA